MYREKQSVELIDWTSATGANMEVSLSVHCNSSDCSSSVVQLEIENELSGIYLKYIRPECNTLILQKSIPCHKC